MDMGQAVERVKQWALQTITFVLSNANADKAKVPLEQLEIQAHRAHVIRDGIFAEALAASGQDADKGGVVINNLLRIVLDWVVANHKTSA
jgi:hypothetical protein